MAMSPHRASDARSNPPALARPAPQVPICTRRFSIALFAAAPILDAVGNEARLWKQELEFYSRRGGDAVNDALSGVLPPKPPAPANQGQRKLDAQFAVTLLSAMLVAAGPKAGVVQAEGIAFASRELPAFQQAGTCGHCGTVSGPAAVKDRDYFDFQAYARGKTLVRLCSEYGDPEGGQESIDHIRMVMGDSILRHILSVVDVNEAEAVGITPFRAFTANATALLSASPELDSIRGGVRALLNYFEKKGERKLP